MQLADRSMERRGGAAASLDLPGFRFHPTEEELLEFYLKQQVAHGGRGSGKKQQLSFDIIPTVHLYRHDPWDLPALAAIASEREWYFFVPRDGGAARGKLQGGGGRPSRTTERGFWKATGSDRAVRCAADPKRLVGLKKTLVYYQGRAPRGAKTDWVMNEYRLPDAADAAARAEQQEVVLCKVYRKAVSLKELEQRVAMEELARARSSSATPSNSHCSAGSPDVSSSSLASVVAHEAAATHHQAVKKEENTTVSVARPASMRLPQLDTPRGNAQVGLGPGGGLEWMQDPFLTQLRSPWMENLCLSPYYASVLNF